jgi:surfeit locus 1 family protein
MAVKGASRLRAAMWPTIAALGAITVLAGLGTWQVQRLHWKESLIAERDARLAAPPIAIEEATPAVEFRRVRVAGRFVEGRAIFLESRVNPKGEAGYHLVMPLLLTSGATVWVDRGWVRGRSVPPASGEAVIEGVVRRGGKPSAWMPDNDPAHNIWFFVDAPFFIDTNPPPEIVNNHLQYVITWYGLALACAAIYGAFVWRRLR